MKTRTISGRVCVLVRRPFEGSTCATGWATILHNEVVVYDDLTDEFVRQHALSSGQRKRVRAAMREIQPHLKLDLDPILDFVKHHDKGPVEDGAIGQCQVRRYVVAESSGFSVQVQACALLRRGGPLPEASWVELEVSLSERDSFDERTGPKLMAYPAETLSARLEAAIRDCIFRQATDLSVRAEAMMARSARLYGMLKRPVLDKA